MEHQITLNEWLEWKEDIRRKLQETAGNFVHIGYRLKQIRDSGLLDGCADIFEFALKEYGLGKRTVSRFIAINERFSEGGNSLELRSEYKSIGSSKLAEMLTLTDAECQLITERTTVKEIRELKNFDRQQASEEVTEEVQYTPLQKCIIDYFSTAKKKEALNQTMGLLAQDPCEANQRRAAELINPGEYATHKKGIVFLFLYDFNTGVKYKKMGEMEPVSMTWTEFLAEIIKIYQSYTGAEEGIWNGFYHVKEEEEKVEETAQNQGIEASVATSQQEEKDSENEEESENENDEECTDEDSGPEFKEGSTEAAPTDDNNAEPVPAAGACDSNEVTQGDVGGTRSESQEDGPDNRCDVTEESSGGEIVTPPLNQLRTHAENLAGSIWDYFMDVLSVDDMELDKLQEVKSKAEELSALLEQIIELKKG